jgi:hypothetical protein
VPSATSREFQVAAAVHVSGSLAVGDAVAAPACVVTAAAETSDHVTEPAPSPVRALTASATEPLRVGVCGDALISTGFDVAATQVALAFCVRVESGPVDRTGTTL